MRQLISQLGDLQGATVQRLQLPPTRSKGHTCDVFWARIFWFFSIEPG